MLKTLRAATFEVLETMFFLFPEDPEGITPDFGGLGLRAWVPVAGPQPFRVGITVPLGLAREMGGNFLGITPEELGREHLEDVVREAANMIVGAFLMRSRASGAFLLRPPTLEMVDLNRPPGAAPPHRIFLCVGDFGLEVMMELAPPAAPRPRPEREAVVR
ncbi:MAG: chemotaxis protein CheX [Deltaproteobacteria bacterium]|nr:chemotaxis protein CheX [Deltaproteobacteria bacterium]